MKWKTYLLINYRYFKPLSKKRIFTLPSKVFWKRILGMWLLPLVWLIGAIVAASGLFVLRDSLVGISTKEEVKFVLTIAMGIGGMLFSLLWWFKFNNRFFNQFDKRTIQVQFVLLSLSVFLKI